MKKPIDKNKIYVAALILIITFFILPISSFGGEGCVYRNVGDIEDLYFPFGDGLKLTLPGLGTVTVLQAEVFASGREMTVVTPFGQYIYHARLWAGQKGSEKGIIRADIFEWPYELWFDFESARLVESFMIEADDGDDDDGDGVYEDEISAACDGEEVTVPEDVNLFFRVKKVTLTPMPYMPDVEFNLILKIKNGMPVFLKIW
jgi:hypothetical protein